MRRTPRSPRTELHVQKSAAWRLLSLSEYRLALCERCRIQLLLCGRCDRGQRLCADCRALRRRASLRRAGGTYRRKPRARRLQAARQSRYRDRQRDKFPDQKVTHHTVTEPEIASTSPLAPEITPGGKEDDADPIRTTGHCSICGAPLPAWATGVRRARHAGRPRRRRAPRVPRGPPR